MVVHAREAEVVERAFAKGVEQAPLGLLGRKSAGSDVTQKESELICTIHRGLAEVG